MDLFLQVKCMWKIESDELLIPEFQNLKDWSKCGQHVINNFGGQPYRVEKLDLIFVSLFCE